LTLKRRRSVRRDVDVNVSADIARRARIANREDPTGSWISSIS
jgi:hypothetical protein